MSFSRGVAMNWDWLGSRPVRREETRDHAKSEQPTRHDPFPPAVDIRMASGSIVRVSIDGTSRRMSFGRVRA